jgi:hypothetical protein
MMTIKSDQHGFEVQAGRPALSQTIAIGGGSIASAPFSTYAQQGAYAGGAVAGVPITTPNNTLHVRLVATSDCWVSFAASPVAGASAITSILLPAGVPEYFWVYPGERVAVIQNVTAGLLNIAEMVA